MEIEAIKDREQANKRAVSILLYKLATADSKNVAEISKELRRWSKKRFIPEFRFHRK